MSSLEGSRLSRREFLLATAAIAASPSREWGTLPQSIVGIVDTHTHFYDPRRFWGVPWPPKGDPLYRPVYPDEFRNLSRPHGVTGTVVVEVSAWVGDNQWLLDLAARNPFLLGIVGSLRPGGFRFAGRLRRFSANPLFRGIRVGVWRELRLADDAAVIHDLKLLADRDLALDVLTAPERLAEVTSLATAIPSLRVIVNHCASVHIDGKAPPAGWVDGLRSCTRHPNVFMKVSGLVEGTGRTDGKVPTDVAFYRPTLDAIWETFGEDRVIFASDWPVCTRFASFATVFGIVDAYVREKGRAAAEKYFFRNAERAYKIGGRS
jgi:L-fuconolactonase